MSRTRISNRQTPSQAQRLIRSLIETLPGERLNAMTTLDLFRGLYGIEADWHEFSNALDALHTNGLINRVGTSNSGLAEYEVPLLPPPLKVTKRQKEL